MKLLLISVKSASPNGGIAVWTNHFLAHCEKKGIDCHLVNTEIIGKRNLTGKRRIWDELTRTIRIVRGLKRQLKCHHFDAVYLNTSCGNFGLFRDAWLGYLVCKKGIPLITHYHCEIPYWVKRNASIYVLGKLVGMSRHNLVLCQNSQSFLQKHYGVSANKVPNFVDSRLVLTAPKPIAGPVTNVLFVGNVTEHKGAAELYEIARRLPKIHFTLIGKANESVTAWPRPNNLALIGHLSQEKVIQQLDQADVFLFPSHTEGCSMALMEAMARGLPAIATDTGANAEMLADGCGFVVPLHDVDAMVKALAQLNDPTVRQTTSMKASNRIKQKYTNKNINVIFGLIQQIH